MSGESWRALFTPHRQIEAGRIVVVGVLTLLFWQGRLALPALVAAVAVGLYPLVKTGAIDLVRERKIGTEMFVTVATVIAMLAREYVAASVLMTIILIAEFIADLNTDRARASITALIGSVPQTATLRSAGNERPVPIAELRPGDVVLVRAGEKIPVDGTVSAGQGAVNEAPITGESRPVDKAAGAQVLAGTVLESGALDVETEKVGADTMFARIITLVETAEQERAPVQKLADRVSAWLIPVVFIFLLAVFLVTHDARKIVTLLIFTSPAELGLATPLVIIAAIARAARSGILIKGGIYLERLAKANAFVFDKTGTLTIGEPRVIRVEPLEPGLSADEILRLAAALDRRSAHPLAKAIVKRAAEAQLDLPEPSAFDTVPGRGVKARIADHDVILGNEAFLQENGMPTSAAPSDADGTVVYLARDRRLAGVIVLADQTRPGARETIAHLKASGVSRIVMLTGDNRDTAQRIGAELGIDEVDAELLPEEKVKAIASLRANGFIVAMVGDGVNDAPALARADVGIAMGARGTQAAIEAADIALMTDDLAKIVTARTLAQRAYRTIKENLIFGVGVVHVLGITAALAGWIGPIQAALLHLGPDILVFVNSTKLLRVSIEHAA